MGDLHEQNTPRKKLDGNYSSMLRAVLNKSLIRHLTKQLLYNYLPTISQTMQVSRARHIGQYWKSKDELISEILFWTSLHRRANVGRPAKTIIIKDNYCHISALCVCVMK